MFKLRPIFWPTAMMLPIVVFALGLSVWQMERREWKWGILDRIAQNQAAAPQAPAGPMDFPQIITWIAVAYTAVTLPMSFVVPRLVAGQNRRSIAAGTWKPPVGRSPSVTPLNPDAFQTNSGKLALSYNTQFIIGAALIEGAAFFAAVAYFIGKNPIALGLALFLVGMILMRFPTRLRVAAWIDSQQELLIQEQQLAT